MKDLKKDLKNELKDLNSKIEKQGKEFHDKLQQLFTAANAEFDAMKKEFNDIMENQGKELKDLISKIEKQVP